MSADRPKVGKLPIDSVTMAEAVERICALVKAGKGGAVYTPNADHVVVAEHNQEFAEAYQKCALSLVDGVPVLIAARLMGYSVKEKVSGSDLVWPLLERAEKDDLTVYLLGGAPGSVETVTQRLAKELPRLRVVGTDAPFIDLDAPRESQQPILNKLRQAKPDLLLVGLGAPKQELWIYRHQAELGATVSLGIGASIDFLAGKVRRAPRFMSNYGFEWLFRLALEPRRLGRRYLLRAPLFLKVVARQAAAKRQAA